jgi:hypothetical protein
MMGVLDAQPGIEIDDSSFSPGMFAIKRLKAPSNLGTTIRNHKSAARCSLVGTFNNFG